MTTHHKLPEQPKKASNLQQLIFLAALCATAYMVYAVFFDTGGQTTSIPRAMQLTYKEANFQFNVDDNRALEILSAPNKYPKDFDNLIYQFNGALLTHVCNRMGLDEPTKALCLKEYDKIHPTIKTLYHNDFMSLQDTSSRLYEAWYENQSANASDILNEVASKYTCFFITQILSTVLKTQDGKLSVKGNTVETPCGIALAEGLRPTIKRLQSAGAIRDFSKARGLMQEKIEKAIVELAVTEVRDKKGIKVSNSTKMMGYNVSATSVEITAISIIKIGFNLNQYFDVSVDNANQSVVITLPQPQILSHEVFPKVENLDVGWMRELNPQDFNDNVNKLRQAFRDDVYSPQNNSFEAARKRAVTVMQMIASPMVRSINRNYKINVRFKNSEGDVPQTPLK